MAYTQQTWVDNDATKPLSAARMTHIEAGVAAAELAANKGAANGYAELDSDATVPTDQLAPGTVGPYILTVGSTGTPRTTNYTVDCAGRYDVLVVATIGANLTFTLSNWRQGTSVTFRVAQDATGGRTLTFALGNNFSGTPGTAIRWPGGVQPALTVTASGLDVISGFSATGLSFEMAMAMKSLA